MSKLIFKTNGKIKGQWEVRFTEKDHAYLQAPYQNVGIAGDWPIVRGASIYSTFHFYLLNGRWTCKHPEYKHSTYFSRVMDLTPPTKGMEEALTAAVEAENRRLIEQVELLAGADDQVGVSAFLELAKNRRPDEAGMACDVYLALLFKTRLGRTEFDATV